MTMLASSFEDVVHFMEGFTNLEKQTDHYSTRAYRLDRMHALLKHIGNPENSFRKLHLAGSKGKGSTASYLASALTQRGYKTGLYMSPHLCDYRERFTLSGTFFSEEQLVEAGNELQQLLKGFIFSDEWGETNPTTFELYTAYAYLLFKLAGCQWAVIETGLGGRLDATNTIDSEAAILCPIELEHTKILGNTIEQIASEKSKIIKKGKPVFIGFEDEKAMSVFRREAEEQQSPVYSLSEELDSYESKTTREGELVHYTWKGGQQDRLILRMRGQVQAQNCALALMVLRTLGLEDQSTQKALENNQIPGRFQQLSSEPDVYVDGAHTPQSLKALLSSFSTLHDETKSTLIYGALEDKDHEHMVNLILDHFHRIIISKPGTFKKSDIASLNLLMNTQAGKRSGNYEIFLVEDNLEALKLAYAKTPSNGAILACGSFYLAGGIKQAHDAYRSADESQLA